MTRTMKGLIVAAGLLAIVSVGCKAKAPTPQDGFNAWVAAIEKCDIPGIKAGMTKTSVERLDAMVAQFAQFMPPEKQKDFDLYKEICKGFKPGSVKFVSEKAEADGVTAVIAYTKDGRELEAPMRLEEGAWRLDMVGMMTRAATMKPAAAPEGEAPAAEPAAEAATAEAPTPAAAPAAEAPAPTAEAAAAAPAAEAPAAGEAPAPAPAAEAPAPTAEAPAPAPAQ